MRKLRILLPCLFLPVLFITALAQGVDLKKYPGYVNLDEIEIPDKAGEVTEITLGPAMLKLAAMADNGDKDLSETLAGLHGIQIKTFDIDSDEAAKLQPIMDKIESQLNQKGWERLVQVKGKDERTVVSIKYDKEKIAGLLVMSVKSGDEAAFVNVVGEINWSTLEDLDLDLDASAIDSLKKNIKIK